MGLDYLLRKEREQEEKDREAFRDLISSKVVMVLVSKWEIQKERRSRGKGRCGRNEGRGGGGMSLAKKNEFTSRHAKF